MINFWSSGYTTYLDQTQDVGFWLRLLHAPCRCCCTTMPLLNGCWAGWRRRLVSSTAFPQSSGPRCKVYKVLFTFRTLWARPSDRGPEHLTSRVSTRSAFLNHFIVLQSSTTPWVCWSSSRSTLFINWTEQRPSTCFKVFGIGWRTRVALCYCILLRCDSGHNLWRCTSTWRRVGSETLREGGLRRVFEAPPSWRAWEGVVKGGFEGSSKGLRSPPSKPPFEAPLRSPPSKPPFEAPFRSPPSKPPFDLSPPNLGIHWMFVADSTKESNWTAEEVLFELWCSEITVQETNVCSNNHKTNFLVSESKISDFCSCTVSKSESFALEISHSALELICFSCSSALMPAYDNSRMFSEKLGKELTKLRLKCARVL